MLLNTRNPSQIYTDKFKITNVDLTSISLAKDDRVDAEIVNWARLFKARTWEELRMLAEKDKQLGETISSAWQLSKDREIREQMRRREENERLWNYTVRHAEEAEKKAEEAERRLEDGLRAAAEEVTEAKNKLAEAENKAVEAENKAAEAENKAAKAEQRATEAERRLAELERRIAEIESPQE